MINFKKVLCLSFIFTVITISNVFALNEEYITNGEETIRKNDEPYKIEEEKLIEILKEGEMNEKTPNVDFVPIEKEKAPQIKEELLEIYSTNIKEYPLVNIGEDIYLWDNYNQLHGVRYQGCEKYSDTESVIKYLYACSNTYIKSDYLWMELYIENNGVLTQKENGYWNVASTGAKFINYRYDTNYFSKEKYLYILLGITDSLYASYYEDYVTFKVENPFYSDWSDHWGKNEIKYAMNNEWVKEANMFRPNDAITRAEFIKIINKAFGFKSKVFEEPFIDVDSGDWWYNEVLIAIKAGYITTKNEKFRPNDSITREEVAAIITSVKKNKDNNLDKLEAYSDKHLVSQWAKTSVEGAIEAGYMGKNSIIFNPKKNITRAESVVTLYRVVK